MPAPRRGRRRRSPARWLAPIALVVAGVAVYAIAYPASSTKDSARTSTQPTTTSTTRSKTRAKKKAARTYTVKPGDTLSGISARTGVSLERIQELNPKLDAGNLQTGATIKLGP